MEFEITIAAALKDGPQGKYSYERSYYLTSTACNNETYMYTHTRLSIYAQLNMIPLYRTWFLFRGILRLLWWMWMGTYRHNKQREELHHILHPHDCNTYT